MPRDARVVPNSVRIFLNGADVTHQVTTGLNGAVGHVYGLLDGNFELYAVDLTGAMPGAPVRVDGDHIPAGARSFRIVPASHDLVYLAERLDPAGDVDLYLEDLDSPDPPVLASDLPVDYSPGNPFGEIDLSPAGDLVVYRAYETDPFYKSAYWVSTSLGPPSTMLHAPLAASETVSLVSFSDSGNLLMYTVLDRDTDERSAYLVDTSGDVPDVPMALGLTVDADEEPVLLYASPDDAWIVYTTRHPTMGATPSVWIRDIAAGEDTRLSQPDAGDVGARAYFTPDSLRVLFTQRTEDPDDPHLFMVKLDSGAPQPAQQVSTELLAFDDPFVAP